MRIKDFLLPSNTIEYKTPIVVARTFTDQITASATWTVTPPVAPIAGRLLLVFVGTIQSRTPVISGWTPVPLVAILGAKGHAMLWKVSDGTETSISVTFGGNTSQGAACYYEIDNVDTSTTFYDLGASANVEPGSDPYTVAVSNAYTITRPSVAFSSTVFINSGAEWTPDNGYIFNGNRLSATAHKIFTEPAPSQQVTWSRVGGATTATKVVMIEIFGKVNTDKTVNFINPNAPKFVNKGAPVFRVNSGAVAVPYPTNIVAGNLLVMACISRGGNITTGAVTSPPAGYTFLGYQYGSGANYTAISIYYKVATGSETGTEAMSINTGTNYACGGQIYQFSGAGTVSSWTVPSSADISGTITQPAISGTRKDLIVIFTTTAANVSIAGNWSGVTGAVSLNAEALAPSTTSTGLGLTWQLNLGTPDGNLAGSCAMSGAVALSAGFRLAA